MSSAVEIERLAAELRHLEIRRRNGALDEMGSQLRQSLLNDLMARLRSQAGPGAERRRHLRIPADLEVRFRLKEATITCNAGELSLSGLGLRGNLWIVENQELLVENLRVGHRDYPTSLKARVIWKNASEDRRAGAGLIFLDVDEHGQRQIHAVFEHLFLAYLDHLAGT